MAISIEGIDPAISAAENEEDGRFGVLFVDFEGDNLTFECDWIDVSIASVFVRVYLEYFIATSGHKDVVEVVDTPGITFMGLDDST